MAEEAEVRNRIIPLVAALFQEGLHKRFHVNALGDPGQNQAVQYAHTCTFCCSKDTGNNTADNNHNQKQTWKGLER